MYKIVSIALIIIILISILGIIYKSIYNKLFFYKIKINEASEIILECLNEKKKLIKNISNIVKKKLNLELDIYKHINEIDFFKSYDAEEDDILHNAYKTTEQLLEDNPQLEKNKNFKVALNQLRENEEKLIAAKSFSNKYAIILNDLLKRIPVKLIGLIHKIRPLKLYETPAIKDEFKSNK